MFTKIVVGIDGASGGTDALALARILASPTNEILLVNAFPYESRPTRGSVVGYEELLREDSEKLLQDAAGSDPSLRTVAVPDVSPARALQKVAETEHADLIVVGACRHRGAIGRVLLGDVSRATLHGAHCPVAVASRDYAKDPRPISTIGVGYEKTPQAQAALDVASGLAREAGAELRLHTMIAVPGPFAPMYSYTFDWMGLEEDQRAIAQRELDTLAASLDVRASASTSVRSASDGLQALSEKVDLMVVGSRGWGAARKVLLGSTGDRLTHHAHCPVVVVPSPVSESDEESTVPVHQSTAA